MKRLFALRSLALIAAAFAAPLAWSHPGHGGAPGHAHLMEAAGQPLAPWLAGLLIAIVLLLAIRSPHATEESEK